MARHDRKLRALKHVFGRTTLRDYHEAGREAADFIADKGPGRSNPAVAEMAGLLGTGSRIIWEVVRFNRTFTPEMVAQAEAMGANWTDLRHFMKTLDKDASPATVDLAGLEAVVAEREDRIKK